MSFCFKCNKEAKTYIHCSKCRFTYHPSCVLKICGMYVGNNKEIICCDKMTSKKYQCEEKDLEIQELKTRIADLNEAGFVQSISLNQASINNGNNSIYCDDEILKTKSVGTLINNDCSKETEIKYLNMIIEGKDDLINELKDKIIILKKYMTSIESNVNERNAPSINSKQSELLLEQIDTPNVEHVNPNSGLVKKPLLPTIRDDKVESLMQKTFSRTEKTITNVTTYDTKKRNSKSFSKIMKEEGNTKRGDPLITGTNNDLSTSAGAPKRAWVKGHQQFSLDEIISRAGGIAPRFIRKRHGKD